MTYSVDLHIPVGPLADYAILNQTSDEPEIWFADPTQISKEFNDWLDVQELVMTYPPLIFYTPPGQQCGIHIDGFAVTDRASVNFVQGGKDSLMHWYKLNPNVGTTKQVETQAGTPYTLYEPHQVEHVFSHAVKWPSIVQVGVPHNITNQANGPRWAISCDISYKTAPEAGLTMSQALEAFKQWM
jgi:hypothetical protein